ncbi:MAG: response regulator transcription factor [Eubacteriales bacterium]|nr:response regulator transcription factor [Eubacteriales bacterium]
MENTPRILVVEDDADINQLICRVLEKNNYMVIQAFSGTEANLRMELEKFDLLILDLMLPGMEGGALLKKLRNEKKSEIPVLVLSARASLADKVRLLTEGADDYMTKPFEPEELLARVYACLRRSGKRAETRQETELLSYKNLSLFPEARKVIVREKEISLTRHEYEILYILLQEPEKVFSRETLYERVWSGGYYGEDNTVNVHVSNLRKKIACSDPEEEYIKTVWGIGFKMA